MSSQLSAATLNGDCHSAKVDRAALQHAMQTQGEPWHGLVTERCPHLFADVPVFIAPAQLRQMREVIEAVERVVGSGKWGVGSGEWMRETPLLNPLPQAGEEANVKGNLQSLGVFYGYDFHLNSDGAHLIEINSNAGGGFLNALLLESQPEAGWPSASPVPASTSSARTGENLEQVFLEMFRNEWRLERGAVALQTVAIVDEQPEAQYLYPEFLLAQRMFERAGIAAYIADPTALHARGDGLYLESSGGVRKIDLAYNRLTDFSLQQHSVLRQAYLEDSAVLTPDPAHYAQYADKRNLARLTDAETLRALGANEADIATLQAGVPQTRLVQAADQEQWWQERKQWFFKPATGYGSKGSY